MDGLRNRRTFQVHDGGSRIQRSTLPPERSLWIVSYGFLSASVGLSCSQPVMVRFPTGAPGLTGHIFILCQLLDY